MQKRPKIKIPLTTTNKIIESLGLLFIVATWAIVFINYKNLPAIIPIHYNGVGEADGFGGKGSIFLMPILSIVLYIGLTILNRYPHVFNYPISITESNALRQYTIATSMIRWMKVIIIFIFGWTTIDTILQAKGYHEGLGIWFLPIILVLIFFPMIYGIIKMVKAK